METSEIAACLAFHLHFLQLFSVSSGQQIPNVTTTIDPFLDFNCKFEQDLCSWSLDPFNDVPWQVTDSVFGIPSAPDGNKFLRLNYNRSRKWGDQGQIFSPEFEQAVHSVKVDFWFYVRSPGLYTYTVLKFGIVNEKRVFHWLFGSAAVTNGWQPNWMQISLCIPKIKSKTRLMFFAEAEKGHEVALDDLVVKRGVIKCKKVTLLSPNVLPSCSCAAEEEKRPICRPSRNGHVQTVNKGHLFLLSFALLFSPLVINGLIFSLPTLNV